MAKIVFNKLLGGWFVVRGPHQAPLAGRFESRQAAAEWLRSRGSETTYRKPLAI